MTSSSCLRLCIHGLMAVSPWLHASDDLPPMLNTKSGISISFSGENGRDWAVEQTCHDPLLADVIVHLQTGTRIELVHNENNVAMPEEGSFPQRVLGRNGLDGKPGSGDEGEIRYTLDHDGQAHEYVRPPGKDLPLQCRLYATSFALEGLTHEDGKPVLGTIGDNGKPFGNSPKTTTERFAYGVADACGNEWHVLTYWDDDSVWLTAGKIRHDKRSQASDGHWIALCASPRTPLVQIRAPAGEQFYTTPLKTYHVPRIWEQTTYLTGGALVGFASLAQGGPVQYRIAQGPWQVYAGQPQEARGLFPTANQPMVVELRCGDAGPILRRTFVRDPTHPAPGEQHGLLLWPDAAALQATRERLLGVEPFKSSYVTFRRDYYQGSDWKPAAARLGWRRGAANCEAALGNAVVMTVEGPSKAGAFGILAKNRLMVATRPEPVGQEITCDTSSPATDFLQVLGQVTQAYADAGVAYDLLAANFRSDQQPGGLTPVEEYLLRDQLAKCAKSLLQFRDSYCGSGDTHWSHGFELATGLIALAMPTYARPCFGISGVDWRSADGPGGVDGAHANQGVTWWQAVTDPTLAAPGYPGSVMPLRRDFLLTDDGWWSGPNYLQTSGDRYFNGRLTDVKHGCMAVSNGIVELVEMKGYEQPFITRLIVWDHARRLRGGGKIEPNVNAYLHRLLLQGSAHLGWDKERQHYRMQPRRGFGWAVPAFNRSQPALALPAARIGMTNWLGELKAYYANSKDLDPQVRAVMEHDRKCLYDAYALALCEDPAALPACQDPVGPPELPPVVRPLFKHVLVPGQALHKDLQAFSPDGRAVTLAVKGLPEGAVFDDAHRTITWTPKTEQAGVHLLTVTASNGRDVSRPFLVVVHPKPLSLAGPAAPARLESASADGGAAIRLTWAPVEGAIAYLIYRESVCWAVGTATEYIDRERIAPGQNTRYHVSAISVEGGESPATAVLHRMPLAH